MKGQGSSTDMSRLPETTTCKSRVVVVVDEPVEVVVVVGVSVVVEVEDVCVAVAVVVPLVVVVVLVEDDTVVVMVVVKSMKGTLSPTGISVSFVSTGEIVISVAPIGNV